MRHRLTIAACMMTSLACVWALAAKPEEKIAWPEVRKPDWPEVQRPEVDPLAPITTYSPEQLDEMALRRRDGYGVGQVWIYRGIFPLAHEVQEMVEKGPEVLARHIVEVYPTDEATLRMQAVALGLLTRSNYFPRYGANWFGPKFDDTLYGPKDDKGKRSRRPEELTDTVNAVVDEILKTGRPHARAAAVETLLQVFSECMGSQHVKAGNGNRKIPPMPRELTARAAEFLDDEDPFVRALADWAICVNVGNENDGRHTAWPGEPEPEWWEAWLAIEADEHLALDYVRQVASLQMHRRGGDLLTLSRDQMRRAQAKADWARAHLPADKAAGIDQRVEEMTAAHERFAAVVGEKSDDLTACRQAYLRWRPTVRAVAMSGPDVDFDSVVYLTRYSGGSHLQPGIHDPWNKAGGDIYVQQGLSPDSPRRALIGEKMPEGFTQDLDLSFDANKVVFSRTNARGVLQLYEIDLTGENLTRVTEGPYNDEDPAYLPDGGIVFGSMEAEAGTMCASALGPVGSGGASHTGIFRLSPDHTRRRRLSYCKDDDCYPAVLNDGRIMWLR